MTHIKVFVYFDTNCLRATSDDEVIYDKFELSSGFQRLENYLKRTSLLNNVKLGISEIVLMELIEQKINQYNSDKNEFYKLRESITTKYEKLKELDEKSLTLKESKFIECFELKVNDKSFDCRSVISQMADEYLLKKEIEIVNVPEDTNVKAIIFDSMIKRAIRKQYPFQKYNSKGKNISDAGFKDVLIWESLLNYNEINVYNEIIFVTNDNVFINCESEFTKLVGKHLIICNNWNKLIEKLEEIFFLFLKTTPFTKYLEKETFFDHIYNDYFREKVEGQINKMDTITIDQKEVSIITYNIVNPCISIEDYLGEEENEDHKLIISEIEITYEENGIKKTNTFQAEIVMDDMGGLEDTSLLLSRSPNND